MPRLTGRIRFRIGFRGRMILQCEVIFPDHNEWQDCSFEQLQQLSITSSCHENLSHRKSESA